MKLVTLIAVFLGIQSSAHASLIVCNGKTEDINVLFKANWSVGSELKDIRFYAADGSVQDYKRHWLNTIRGIRLTRP